MNLPQKLLNYPCPLIAVNKDGFVVAKNYIAEIKVGVIHKGASIKKYTDIDITKECLSRGEICGNEYTYFTIFHEEDGESFTLLFFSLATFGEDLLPFDILELYKEKIVSAKQSEISSNKERQYIRSIHNNLIKANYFTDFFKIFNLRLTRHADDEEKVVLSQICSAIDTASKNYLENLDIEVDIDYSVGTIVANISEIHIVTMLLNALMFSVINSGDKIKISLSENRSVAKISFEFYSSISFDKMTRESENSVINSSLSLLLAIKIASEYGFGYSWTKGSDKSSLNTLSFDIPVSITSKIPFASRDTVTETVAKLMLNIFYDEKL